MGKVQQLRNRFRRFISKDSISQSTDNMSEDRVCTLESMVSRSSADVTATSSGLQSILQESRLSLPEISQQGADVDPSLQAKSETAVDRYIRLSRQSVASL